MNLDERIKAINTAIADGLTSDRVAVFGPDDPDISRTVIVGSFADIGDLAREAVWVVPEYAVPVQQYGAGGEDWDYTLSVYGWVESGERPQEQSTHAQDIAQRAASSLIRAGRSGSELGCLISDVLRSQWLPAGNPGLEGVDLIAAGQQLVMRFHHREELT